MNQSMSIPDMKDVRIEVIHSIIQSLGLIKSSMFFRENFSTKTDYLIIKQELFNNSTVDDVFNEMKIWKAKNSI